MISLDLMKSSEVRIAGDRSMFFSVRNFIRYLFEIFIDLHYIFVRLMD